MSMRTKRGVGGDAPPFKLTPARVGHELWCIVGVLTISASYAWLGVEGLALHTFLFGVGSVVMDYVISPTMANNLVQLKDHGCNTPAMVVLMLANLVGANCLVMAMTIGFGCFEAKWDEVGWQR
jgi:hypothetical protein